MSDNKKIPFLSKIKKGPFLSKIKWNEIKERYSKCRAGLSAVFYAAMVFIVIFGLSQNVYAGFPAPVPYIIIALFLLMAFVRLYESLVSDQPVARKKKQKSKPQNGAASKPQNSAASKPQNGAASKPKTSAASKPQNGTKHSSSKGKKKTAGKR